MTKPLAPAPKPLVEDLARHLSGPKGLAPLSAQRLGLLIELMDPAGYIGYAAAYARLFPDSGHGPAAKTRADKAFHKFRHTLKETAAHHRTYLELQLDTNRNADPEQRRLWFAAEDNAEQRLTDFNRGTTDDRLLAHAQEQAVQVRDEERSYLLLYAEQEADDAHKLHAQLRTQLAAAGKNWGAIDFHRDIPLGADRDRTRADYLEQADLILLLIGPRLIVELRRGLIDPPKDRPLLPLALMEVTGDQLADTPLAGLQIFRDAGGKSWKSSGRRGDWATAAAQAILAHVTRPDGDRSATTQKRLAAIERFSADHLGACPASHYVDLQLRSQPGDPKGREALPFLLDWLRQPLDGLPYCAIFGELGMGKTTLSQRLTRELLNRRATEPTLPLPVYLDLRAINAMNWDWKSQGVPSLDALLGHLLAAAYNIPVGQARPSVEDIKRLVQEQGGLVIFDGLDEVMNHLPPDQCHHFIQRLWEILPPRTWLPTDPARPPASARPPADKRVGRLVMTCRSHFFQTLRDQIGALAGRQREIIKAEDYLWVTLLPFGREQVETYFRQVFAAAPERAERVLEMLDRIHDLRGLSSRPYNLRLIQDQVETLEAIHRQGGRVGIADLYEGLVEQWTDRDSPKHRLDRDHKLRLMERLAHRLWSRKQKSLDYRELENWLLDQLLADPRRQLAYRAYLDRENGADILQEDLRNASFLVREGEAGFRFAHTSILEFFLARALLRALEQASDPDPTGDPEQALAAWRIPIPSPETLDFLGELLRTTDQTTWQPALRTIREHYRPGSSELLLAYGLHAHRHGLPAPSLVGMDLTGADLKDWRFAGPATGPPLNLSRIRLTGCRLMNARFRRIDLTDADLTRADLTRAELWEGSARNARFQDADLTGARFHSLDLTSADLRARRRYRTQLLSCNLENAQGLDDGGLLTANCRPATHPPPSPTPGDLARALTGHQGWVLACAWSPDGRRLLSAGQDGTLRLWDATSGETLAVLQGHQASVRACAWSPDGRRLLSASDDRTLRLWDAAGGESLAVLTGHQDEVNACVWSPDGRRLLSAGEDRTLRLWDAAGGEALAVLQGHQGGVLACDWSPDGRRLLSAGEDRTLRLWDAAGGESLAVLQGHQGWVQACAWSPDGRRLLSAGDDRTLRLWDAAGGEPLAVLQGHQDWVRACAWSPDGRRLLSAGQDGTLRLWDAAGGEALAVLQGHQGWVLACAWSPDGRRPLSAGEDGTLRLWDAGGGESLAVLQGHQTSVLACTWSPDGHRLLSAGADGDLCLWDAANGETLAILEGHQGPVLACAWSPNGSPDGRRLLSAGDDRTLRLWDAAGGETLAVLQGHRASVNACAWSPDGCRLLSAGRDGTLRLWDATGGEALAVLQGHQHSVLACAWSPDGRHLLSASADGDLRLWDATSGETLAVLEGHQFSVNACAWSPDGRRLLSAGQDRTLRLWDAAGGETLAVLEGHQGAVRACAWSPDGGRL
ncbi:MAG: pentapeptide repeat-containing protein, partial [Candidatus Thiosymbion ectosymbiont of Robbea hypermnestra]|nr:pentapeptide repeat-containing protein [Candidatus Thiosymbion ectosymbiont of Robbea hypermnestra]